MAGASTVRLDEQTLEAVHRYMDAHGMTFSQAIRMLVALALKAENEDADAVFRAQAFREGVRAGAAALSERVQTAMKDAFSDFEASDHE